MRAIRGRPVVAIGVAATVVAGMVLAAIVAGVATAPGRPPSEPPSSGVAVSGPVVYYELLDAEGSSLMERRLDGRSLPRQVARRTDVDYGRTWTVDPTGNLAIALVPGDRDQELVAVAVAGGATVWDVRTPIAPIDAAMWAGDGSRFAITTVGDETEARQLVVVDAATGAIARARIPDDAVVQAFDRDGGVVLRERRADVPGSPPSWQFLRFDPATSAIDRLSALPDVGPASNWSEDVHPGAGLAVVTDSGTEGQGAVLRLWHLAGGPSRPVATFPSIDRIAMDPSGGGVAISVDDSIRYVAIDGRARELYSGADQIVDFAWSAGGDYLAIATDRHGPNLVVVEGATGRAVVLPQPDTVGQSLFVRIVGGPALPAAALPATELGPTPTAGPSGADVAGFPGVLSEWIEPSAASTSLVHVERLVPTEGGGLRVAAAMPTVELEPADAEGATVSVVPRPGGPAVLVWIQTDGGSRGWLWDGVSSREPLDLPADWPTDATDVAWRPDGAALAASATVPGAGPERDAVFAIATIGGSATTLIPIAGDYDRFEGWWSATELRVGHVICTEGCPGRYSYSARFRISDRRLTQMTPADRSHGDIDYTSFLGESIILSMINDDTSDNVVIDLPASTGPDTIDSIGFAGDGRTFRIAVRTADGTDIEAIDDPVGRAVGGRLHDPRPKLVGHLAGRGLRIDVSPDGAWAIVTDRVENVRLIHLGDGRAWQIDRDRTLVWP
jgi:hypothetical protein